MGRKGPSCPEEYERYNVDELLDCSVNGEVEFFSSFKLFCET